jgi:diguanylate cyclase (GGDEF)-like protein/PAS domain S-box-containing protein
VSRSIASLEAAGELFRTAFDEAPIGMCLVRPDGGFLQVNAAFARMMGYPPEELVRLRVADITHPHDRPQNLALLRSLVSGELDRYAIRKLNVRRDGSTVPVLVNVAAVRDDDGRLLYIVAQLQDLTAQLEAETALRRAEEAHRRMLESQARHDLLTGLPNRRDLADRLDTVLERVRGGAAGAALLFCDLDNFKAVNDAWGHAVGDQLLVAVAARLSRSIGATQTVVRFGGDEFVALVPDVDTPAAAAEAGRRFAELFAAPFTAAGREFAVTVSVGVAHAPSGCAEEAESLLRNADTAMYRAKGLGRDRVVVFSEALRRELLDRVELENDLRGALARGELFCHYQPLVDLRDRRVFRAEALVRWRHPERGVLAPDAFMAGVERAALATPLGDRVLELAARQAGAWRRAGEDVGVAVNLSAQQIRPGLPEAVSGAVERSGIPPERLCLELTESTLFEIRNLDVLRDLAARGVCLAVDDFGTGYSSFAYLRDLPVHEVKLDRSFVVRLDDQRTERVVAGMIRLAHELGLKVVAEGVETRRQLDILLGLDCDAAQGFYFAVPSENPLARRALAV